MPSANTARWPGVHTHWLFYFPVADLEASLTLVRAKGGKALSPVAKRTRLLVCFGLATLLMMVGIPWPGRPGGRPLFRGL